MSPTSQKESPCSSNFPATNRRYYSIRAFLFLQNQIYLINTVKSDKHYSYNPQWKNTDGYTNYKWQYFKR